MTGPSGLGWGADINEEGAKAQPWKAIRSGHGSRGNTPSELTFGLPSI